MAPSLTITMTTTPGVVAAYGNGISMDGLGNARLIGTSNRVAFRFRAAISSTLTSARIYVLAEAGLEGYCGGDFGTMQVNLCPDDGTADHLPDTGTTLATVSVTPPGNGAGVLYTFGSPPAVTRDALYHLVMTNTAADPMTNNFSTDSIYNATPDTPRNPSFADVDWGQSRWLDGGPWVAVNQYTPIAKLSYGDGTVQGQGVIDSRWGHEADITDTYRVRERFTSTRSVTVGSMGVRLRRISGTAALALRLETSAGAEVATVTVPAASVPISERSTEGTARWAVASLASPVALGAGTYHLMLTTTAGTVYSIWPTRRGENYGYPGTYYADGVAEHDPGTGTWAYWDAIYDDADLQFYLGG